MYRGRESLGNNRISIRIFILYITMFRAKQFSEVEFSRICEVDFRNLLQNKRNRVAIQQKFRNTICYIVTIVVVVGVDTVFAVVTFVCYEGICTKGSVCGLAVL
uniref:Transmembrane protein n=1 Tax=Glossina austeni TaxID=7395 RepID=A0A1A9UIT8_GLOAU